MYFTLLFNYFQLHTDDCKYEQESCPLSIVPYTSNTVVQKYQTIQLQDQIRKSTEMHLTFTKNTFMYTQFFDFDFFTHSLI